MEHYVGIDVSLWNSRAFVPRGTATFTPRARCRAHYGI